MCLAGCTVIHNNNAMCTGIEVDEIVLEVSANENSVF